MNTHKKSLSNKSGQAHVKTFSVSLRPFTAIFSPVKPLTSHTCKLTDAQAAAPEAWVKAIS
jgi:hypothetical protein